MINKQLILKEFQQIPGVGKVIAQDLWDLDFRSIKELKNKDPEELYIKLCAHKSIHVDRCMLYVFRCAVYFASNKIHDPELLKWWNWKDKKELDELWAAEAEKRVKEIKSGKVKTIPGDKVFKKIFGRQNQRT